jgi:hypothetical protein
MLIIAVEFKGKGYVKVIGTMEDGSKEELFSYYSDEIQFCETELVGLTSDEARALRHKKDVEYLKS